MPNVLNILCLQLRLYGPVTNLYQVRTYLQLLTPAYNRTIICTYSKLAAIRRRRGVSSIELSMRTTEKHNQKQPSERTC